MCASSSRATSRIHGLDLLARSIGLVLAALALAACGTDAPRPEVTSDVATLRRIITADPARQPIAEADRAADDRPVLASRLLASGAIPAAERQVAAVHDASMTSTEGRTWAGRLEDAYEARARGLETWRAYLGDQATNDEQLLDAMTTLRAAEVEVITIDREMDRITPIERPARRGESAEQPPLPDEEDPR